MLFGWVPLTIYLFFIQPPHRAVLFSVIGGWLFLPMAGYDLPGLPPFDKYTSISLGLSLGGWLSGQRMKAGFKWTAYDLPLIVCCLSPIPTALTNNLGLYTGIAGVYEQVMVWGIPYLAGRIYFRARKALWDLCLGIVVGGMIYSLLCLYEIRMSPRLNINFYGFFQHDWRQHRRYGGWRPIIFMQHGIMVAVWMAAATTAAFWLWRSRLLMHIKGISMSLIVPLLFITTLLCKSASGWFAVIVGCGSYFIHRSSQKNTALLLLLLIVPGYIGFRLLGIIAAEQVETFASHFVDAERIASLSYRLLQEDLFIQRAMERPLFGWGGFSRAWPVDPKTGEQLDVAIDSLWIIALGWRGFLGIGSLIVCMLIGPWAMLRRPAKESNQDCTSKYIIPLISLLVVLFMIDCLFNAMINPIYILCSGALLGTYLYEKK
jgi:hypothetical protein